LYSAGILNNGCFRPFNTRDFFIILVCRHWLIYCKNYDVWLTGFGSLFETNEVKMIVHYHKLRHLHQIHDWSTYYWPFERQVLTVDIDLVANSIITKNVFYINSTYIIQAELSGFTREKFYNIINQFYLHYIIGIDLFIDWCQYPALPYWAMWYRYKTPTIPSHARFLNLSLFRLHIV